MSSYIRAFYKNKNILITGGTGFLGTGIIEKLLRSFPDVGNIYLIARKSKTLSVKEREQQYTGQEVFNTVNKQNGDFSKLKWIEGNITSPNLGLSRDGIKELQNNVDVIIHSAAMSSFMLPLKAFIEMNLRPTKELLNIASGCKQLSCFVYVSTAYSQIQSTRHYSTESIMEHPVSPHDLLDMANVKIADQMESQVKDFTKDFRNLYMYSKNAAENLMPEYVKHFPILVYRPGIITHSFREPTPFWLGNNYGFTRILLEAKRGHVFESDPDANADCLPVDFCTNALLACLYRTAQDNKLMVCNSTSANNPITFSKAYELYRNSFPPKYFSKVLQPHRFNLLSMKNVQPGSIQEKTIQEMEAHDRLLDHIYFFMQTPLSFPNDNVNNLWAEMSQSDRKLLHFDLSDINWREFFRKLDHYHFGIPLIQFEDL